MRDFKKQRGRQAQYLRMGVGLSLMAGLGLVAFGTAHAAWGMYGKFSDAAAADQQGLQELASLQTQYQSVSGTVAQMGTPRGIDAEVRERWSLGLPGEREIDIVAESSSSPAAAQASQGFWSGLFSTLFGWM